MCSAPVQATSPRHPSNGPKTSRRERSGPPVHEIRTRWQMQSTRKSEPDSTCIDNSNPRSPLSPLPEAVSPDVQLQPAHQRQVALRIGREVVLRIPCRSSVVSSTRTLRLKFAIDRSHHYWEYARYCKSAIEIQNLAQASRLWSQETPFRSKTSYH